MAPQTIRIEGVPSGYTASLLRSYFETYGEVTHADVSSTGTAAVGFSSSDAVSLVLQDADMVELGGKKVQLTLGSLKPNGLELANTEDERMLDVCVIRGACTKPALGFASRLAQAKVRVVCVWDRRSTEESVQSALSTKAHDHLSSLAAEEKDKRACAKAEELSGMTASPRVAVVHFVSDKMASASSAFPDGPLNHGQELLDLAAGNHMETIAALKAGTVYAEWLAKHTGALFMVFPSVGSRWDHDLALSSSAVHRACGVGMLSKHRYTETSQPTIGLQLLVGVDPDASAETLCQTVVATLSMPPRDMASLDMKTLSVGS
mmetsp:Transcript_29058/g.52944  ORF Transcript_29058/g.52944 Transcript_29058/m.52944 type:complete len:320 (-) Transcript_29058:47-1006(-)